MQKEKPPKKEVVSKIDTGFTVASKALRRRR